MTFPRLLVTALLAATFSTRALFAQTLSVPAFTAYSESAGGMRIESPAGVSHWEDPAAQVLWFGELKQPGTLSASVSMRLAKGTTSRLKLTVGAQSREVSVNGAGPEIVTVSFGAFEVAKAGYTRFALSSLNQAQTPAGDIEALLLEGAAVKDAHFNLLPRRNAASVHINYPLPKDTELDAFYSECTAVEEPVATFYMACGFQRGYFGMQLNSPTERRIIFSVWDSGSGKNAMKRDGVAEDDRTLLLAKGEGVVGSAFGGEGTGGHSHLVYPWKTGEKQRFLLTSKPGENGTATFSGYWFHPEKKAWMLIASFQAPKASAALGHFHSFSENFGGSNGYLRRKALYGNQWVHVRGGDWREITEATFSHDATGKADRLDRFMGVEAGRFFLSHGGFIEGSMPFGERFSRPAMGIPPNDLPVAFK